jgi:hypothetical protein
MNQTDREDMLVISMGIDALLEHVRRTEAWWELRGDRTALQRTQQLGDSVLATRRRFFGDEKHGDPQIAEALAVARGLRDAAKLCREGQPALNARLTGAAEMIECLCRSREVRP